MPATWSQAAPATQGRQTYPVELMSRSLYMELIRRAARRFHAKFAFRAQMRSHYAIHLSDAVAQFESATPSSADCSGEAGGLVTVRETDALWQRDSLIRRAIAIRSRVPAAATWALLGRNCFQK